MKDRLDVMQSGGNAFADLELPEPEERLLKAELSLAIRKLIESRSLTQLEPAIILDTEQPRVSDILRGRVRGFSVEQLRSYAAALDRDIRVRIAPHGTAAYSGMLKRGRTRVQTACSVNACACPTGPSREYVLLSSKPLDD